MSSRSALHDQSDLHVTLKKTLPRHSNSLLYRIKISKKVSFTFNIHNFLLKPKSQGNLGNFRYSSICKLLVYVVTTAILPTNTNPTITKTFLTSEGIAQAIITQNVTFRSGFHAKSTHFNPLHRFQNLSMLPFLATAVRSMVCDCVTHRKPISVRMLIFAVLFLAYHCLKLLRLLKWRHAATPSSLVVLVVPARPVEKVNASS